MAQYRKALARDAGTDRCALSEVAELVLPLLNPAELASVASSCKTLHAVSKSITARRIADASRSLESLPIPFVNDVDEKPYAFFIYTPVSVITDPSIADRRRQWGARPVVSTSRHSNGATEKLNVPEAFKNWRGCSCDTCDQVSDGLPACPCWGLKSSEMVTECGPGCGCGLNCVNRLTQKGVSVRLKIVNDRRKGWGLHTDGFIHRGQFVCEYAGELLSTKEARERQNIYDQFSSIQGGSALLVVREHLPSGKACIRINIDATRAGNIARFMNHSCDGGNLSTKLVRVSGVVLPRICFFATRDIPKNEELTFSYGFSAQKPKSLPCFCSSLNCVGTLPSEDT